MVSTPPAHRYIELDIARMAAIVMMVTYHFAYDLEKYYGWPVLRSLGEGGWIFARATASLFLVLVGCSFAISWHRQKTRHSDASFGIRYRKYLFRGFGIVACGMLVTLVTYFFDHTSYVRFGILHLIGVSILLLPFFAGLKEGNALLGAVIILLGWKTTVIPDGTSWLLPFGIIPEGFMSVDYYPLLPWFGVVVIGEALGHRIYVRHLRPETDHRLPLWLTWSGRHALIIYLIHQPIILGILGFLGFFGFL